MARAPLKAHTLKVGTKNYTIKLPDVYQGLGTVTGISSGSPENSDGGHTLSTAKMAGLLGQIRISYKDGTKTKSSLLSVAIDKMDTAVSDVLGKQYRGFTIASASIPRRRILR